MGDNIIQVTFVHVTCRRRRQRRNKERANSISAVLTIYTNPTQPNTHKHTQTDLTKRENHQKKTKPGGSRKRLGKPTRVWVQGENKKPAAPCETMTICVANRLCREEFRCN